MDYLPLLADKPWLKLVDYFLAVASGLSPVTGGQTVVKARGLFPRCSEWIISRYGGQDVVKARGLSPCTRKRRPNIRIYYNTIHPHNQKGQKHTINKRSKIRMKVS